MTPVLAIALYALRVVPLPANASLDLSPPLGAPGPYVRPATIALARNGAIAAVITSPGGETRLLIVRADRSSVVLARPSDALLRSSFRIGVGASPGARAFPGARLQNIALAADGTPFVTVAAPFSGAFGGIEEAAFLWQGAGWRQAISGPTPLSEAQFSVAATDTPRRVAYNADYFQRFPNYDAAERDPHYRESSVLLADGGRKAVLGYGIATAMRGRYVVGFSAHVTPINPPPDQPRASEAVVWTDGRQRVLGPGVAYGVNGRGEVVGDDERTLTDTRRSPTLWRAGRAVRLDPGYGSAYGIADDGSIVGYLGNDGFIVRAGSGRVPVRLDRLLRDRSWHVIVAYAISQRGTILALARRARGDPQLVVLDPLG